jgi:hypothetical protein
MNAASIRKLSLALGLLAIPALVAVAQRDAPSREIRGDPMYLVLPQDAIPAIDDPELTPVIEVGKRAHPDEPFLGFVHDGEAHAYSTWLLEGHEIVNDVVGGKAIAATW